MPCEARAHAQRTADTPGAHCQDNAEEEKEDEAKAVESHKGGGPRKRSKKDREQARQLGHKMDEERGVASKRVGILAYTGRELPSLGDSCQRRRRTSRCGPAVSAGSGVAPLRWYVLCRCRNADMNCCVASHVVLLFHQQRTARPAAPDPAPGLQLAGVSSWSARATRTSAATRGRLARPLRRPFQLIPGDHWSQPRRRQRRGSRRRAGETGVHAPHK